MILASQVHIEVIRVPATCNATGEPMLLTAALLQLGGKQVSRNVPAKCLEIKEVENAVLKVLVYKDQCPKDWESFIDKPVRQVASNSSLRHSFITGGT